MAKLSFFILFILVFSSCQQKATKKNLNKEKIPSSKNIVEYAKNLKIYRENDNFKIEIIVDEKSNKIYKAILRKEKPKDIPVDYDYIQIPIKKVAALSVTHLGMLNQLNQYKILTAVTDKKYISDTRIVKKIEKNKLKTFDSEGEVSVEALFNSNTKHILYSDFGNGFPNEDKVKKLLMKLIPISEWKEKHPLGRAEWILFFGCLTDQFDESVKIFKSIKRKYYNLLKTSKNLKNQPTILSGNSFGDIWYAPAGNSFNAVFFKHAAGKYVYADEKSENPSLQKSLEQIIKENNNTKIWLNPGISSKEMLLKNNPKVKYLSMFKNNEIYCYSHNMNYFWEESAINPHWVLEDLIRIFHPKALPKGKMHFYKKVN